MKVFSFTKIKKTNTGFSLVELLMVSAIFFIILGVTLFKQSRFSSDILISNTAYDVALSIREAQVFGVGSREADVDPSLPLAYGVHFEIGEKGSYKTFLDGREGSQDYVYTAGEEIENISLTREQKIKEFAVANADGVWDYPDSADIVFKKPDLDARIRPNGDSGGVTHPEIRIMVQSSLGDKCRIVSVTSVGQISVLPVCSAEDTCSLECFEE